MDNGHGHGHGHGHGMDMDMDMDMNYLDIFSETQSRRIFSDIVFAISCTTTHHFYSYIQESRRMCSLIKYLSLSFSLNIAAQIYASQGQKWVQKNIQVCKYM